MAAVADSVENDTNGLPKNETNGFQKNETLPPFEANSASALVGNPSADSQSSQPTENLAAGTSDGDFTGIDECMVEKWPGWPGDCVFRMIVPVTIVGAIIGRKGEFIKKMCEETRARIKVLEGSTMTPDRVVLIYGKEEPEASLSPAMDAALRVFKRVSGLPENDDNDDGKTARIAFSSVRLLVPICQAINLIGKHGSLIKSIVEQSGASVRILAEEDNPFYVAEDERIVEFQGEAYKVLKALEAVVSHLRKFLVDHTVVPLFEKQYLARSSQGRQAETLFDQSSLRFSSQGTKESDFSLLAWREPLFPERESRVESRIQPLGVSIYSQDPVLSASHSPRLGRVTASFVTQVAQTMQIPFSYAEDIIGIEGANIAYIRRTSGASITIQESLHSDEITVEIKGMSTQVQIAHQLIQDFISQHKEPVSASVSGGYVPTYPHLSSRSEPVSSGYVGSEISFNRPTPYTAANGSEYRPAPYTAGVSGQTNGSEYRPAGVSGLTTASEYRPAPVTAGVSGQINGSEYRPAGVSGLTNGSEYRPAPVTAWVSGQTNGSEYRPAGVSGLTNGSEYRPAPVTTGVSSQTNGSEYIASGVGGYTNSML